MTRVARLLGAAFIGTLLVAPARAHVGSPDTWFEGTAGRYPVRVVDGHETVSYSNKPSPGAVLLSRQ